MEVGPVVTPPRSPVRRTAGQRMAQKLWGKSPGWKERFRLQCLEKLNDVRFQAQKQHRESSHSRQSDGMVIDENAMNVSVMYDGDSYQAQPEDYDRLWMQHFIEQELSTFEPEDDDHEIEFQLTLEENARLCEELNLAMNDEAELMQLEDYFNRLDSGDEGSRENDDVPCPICRTQALVEEDGCITCSCGLRVDILYDYMNLEYLRHRLGAVVEEHAYHCEGNLAFHCEEHQGAFSVLISSCDACGWAESVP